jgi:cysteinyl-tRNA synthetase
LTSEQDGGLDLDLVQLQQLVAKFGLDVTSNSVEQIIDALVEYRGHARLDKDFILADSVRDELLSLSIALDDTVDGTTWNML